MVMHGLPAECNTFPSEFSPRIQSTSEGLDFPRNELLSAIDLDTISVFVFKLCLSPYPIRRALPLVKVISRDFND